MHEITLSDAMSLTRGVKKAAAEGRYIPLVAMAAAKLADELESLQAHAKSVEEDLRKTREQEPVTFVCDYNGYAIDGKHTEIDTALPVGTDLYARPVPAAPAVGVPDEWRDVITELADDLSIELDMRYQSRNRYPSELRKYENEMQPVYRARALLQSTGDQK